MNSGNWLARLVMSTAWHCWYGVVGRRGSAGREEDVGDGLTMALLPSAMTRSLKNPVLDRPSVIAANLVELSPWKTPLGTGMPGLGPTGACQTMPLPMSAM